MKIIIDEFTDNSRIDMYLANYMQDISRSKIQNAIKSQKILINNSPTKPSYILKEGDEIDIIDDIAENIIIEPQNIPIEVLWENSDIAVINKPSGMLTHPTTTETSNTLVNALLYKYKDNLSDINGEFRRGIVHRLDRNTSGLLLIAKNNFAHDYLATLIKKREITKKYLTIVKGIIEEDEFIINKPIGRNVNQPHKMCVCTDGKESITKVKVLERLKDATLLEIHLITGRTHQIRVHMSSIGHPVYNDTLYGFGKMKIKTEEQVLQSYKLEFNLPDKKESISIEIDPDEKIKKVLNALK